MDWLWQNLFSSAIYALLVVAGGALLAWIRARKAAWAPILLYGLAGSGLVLSIIIGIQAMHYFSSRSPLLDQGNVESVVRKWLDNFHLSITKMDDSESSFALVVGLHNGTPLIVRRTKSFDHYITIQGTLVISPGDLTTLKKLPSTERDKILQQVILEASRQKIVFSTSGNPFQSITLERRIPITSNLSENAFINGIDDIDNALIALRETFAINLANTNGQTYNNTKFKK